MESSNVYEILSIFAVLSMTFFISFFFSLTSIINSTIYNNDDAVKNVNPMRKKMSIFFDDIIKIINAVSIVIIDVVNMLKNVSRYVLMFVKRGMNRLYMLSGNVGKSERNAHFLNRSSICRMNCSSCLE